MLWFSITGLFITRYVSWAYATKITDFFKNACFPPKKKPAWHSKLNCMISNSHYKSDVVWCQFYDTWDYILGLRNWVGVLYKSVRLGMFVIAFITYAVAAQVCFWALLIDRGSVEIIYFQYVAAVKCHLLEDSFSHTLRQSYLRFTASRKPQKGSQMLQLYRDISLIYHISDAKLLPNIYFCSFALER